MLFVDEAQNLSITALEELRMLSNLQVNGQPALQSFLLGQPQFRQTLARKDLAQLRQRVIASYHLGPLNLEETGAYICHRLEVVGWTKDPIFDGPAIEVIFQITGGIPRQINTLCNRLMLNAYLEENHTITTADVRKVSAEIAEELGLVVDFESAQNDLNETDGLSEPDLTSPDPFVAEVSPESSAVAPMASGDFDVPIPHVEDQVVFDLEAVDEALRVKQGPEHGIPDYGEDRGDAEVIDLTIHAGEELSLEAELRLKKRALHTVIDFFGGRAS